MIFLSYVFFSLAILSIWISNKVFKSYASPLGVMSFIWFFVLGMYHLRLYPYHPLEATTWICVLGGLGLFYVGSIMAIGLNIGSNGSNREHAPYEQIDLYKLRKITVIFWIIGVIGFLFLSLRIVYLFGITSFFKNPQIVHDNFTVRYFGYLWLLNALAPVLAYVYLRIAKRNRVFMWIIIISSLTMLLFSISRTNALRALLMMFFVDTFLRISKHPFRVGLTIALIVIILFASFSYIKSPTFAQRLEQSSFKPKILKRLSPAYGYLTAPIATFEAMRKDVERFDYGINTFVSIAKFLHIFWPDTRLPEWPGKYYANPIRCNVYTYLEPYYKDFGVYGVIVFCFLQGFLVTFFYVRMVKYRRYEYFLFNALMLWCCFISFFSNHFRGNSTLFLAIMSYAIGKYVIISRS